MRTKRMLRRGLTALAAALAMMTALAAPAFAYAGDSAEAAEQQSSGSQTAVQTEKIGTVTTNGGRLNLRDGASTSYGVIIEVDRSKLGMDGTGVVDVLNVKCDPTIIGMLRMQPGFYPAYHMNKEKWVSILLCGPAADDEIKELIEFSYQLTSSRKNEPKLSGKQ